MVCLCWRRRTWMYWPAVVYRDAPSPICTISRCCFSASFSLLTTCSKPGGGEQAKHATP